MKRSSPIILALLLPLLLLGCSSLKALQQAPQLEATVVAMQTDVALELAELRQSISTPPIPRREVPLATSVPLIPTGVPTFVLGGTVATEVLNLRSGPGLQYELVGHLQKGDPVQARARTEAGDWLKVATAAGLEGWVAVEFVALNVPLDGIPLAVAIPPTPTPDPSLPVTSTLPVTSQ